MFNRKNKVQEMDAFVEERLSEYLDGTLREQERQIVEAYLAENERARASLESLRYTVSLLKQTPAPVLPRQFTLPVTSRAPARVTPPWLVWSLRGVAVAATAAFVLLLTATLLRQNSPNQSAVQAPMAAAQATPSVMVALAPTPLPTFPAQEQQSSSSAQEAPAAAPFMVTVEPPADTPQPETTPLAANAPTNKVPATEFPPAPAQDTLPASAALPQPTVNSNAGLAAPTATEILKVTDATAAGSSAPATTPEPAAPENTRRTMPAVTIEGTITAELLRVRTGPGIEYTAIGNLGNGERVKIVGRDHSGDWLVIEYPKNTETGLGWIGALFVKASLPIDPLPVFDTPKSILPQSEPTGGVPGATKTPTAVPTVMPTPSETPTGIPTSVPTPTKDATSLPTDEPTIEPATPTVPAQT